ncbi:MAG TPA: hypothetical protein VJK08_02555 [Patescibacteria group bacterium]|nr:hypothetical protein [Patescibacteria group bacterium]
MAISDVCDLDVMPRNPKGCLDGSTVLTATMAISDIDYATNFFGRLVSIWVEEVGNPAKNFIGPNSSARAIKYIREDLPPRARIIVNATFPIPA